MSRGMWAMMTLLEVFDCSFSDSLVHKFSAPEKTPGRKSDATRTNNHIQYPSDNDIWPNSNSKIDYLAHLWQPTPWGPRRQRWLGNEAWGGSVPPATPPCHEVPAAALIDCCWTVPIQSRALPVQMRVARLRSTKSMKMCPFNRLQNTTIIAGLCGFPA